MFYYKTHKSFYDTRIAYDYEITGTNVNLITSVLA